MVNKATIESFQEDGIAFIPGLFKPHVKSLRVGVQKNIDEPGPFAAENLKEGEAGRFFDDYCNWQRIPQFEQVIRNSAVASVAADLMGSQMVQLFHDHVLVKEPGTSKPTPWHQDSPYYFVEGHQKLTVCCPSTK